MLAPVILGLVAKYPSLRLTVLTKRQFAPIFEGIPNVEVHTADVKKRHKGLMGLWRLYKELEKLKVTGVADLHNVLRSQVLKKYFLLSGIPFQQIDKGRKEKRALTKGKEDAFKPLKPTHQRYADVFSVLDFPIDLREVQLLKRQPLSDKLLNLVQQDSKKWVGIAPFAAHEGKMFSLSSMEKVISTLNDTNKYKIILFGGGEQEIIHLDRLAQEKTNIVNVAGKLSLSEELILISNLDVMVSMDSGNAHLAANYGIPVITLWGVTHPYAGFYPFDQPMENALLSDREQFPLIPTSVYGNKVPKGYEKVMESISVEEVIAKINALLVS
ncbi:ADP-heptose--LPS heptosyltransferase RfaF [Flagellimonas allohymeniacidonis]|uniref:ADP-heptose--LPS heptosyltransferase RfaF n=2 Tax=Flagellimonas allohymeniacidonis TaxID=2517819 RepID=A0A4Q8QCV6_9FLAO|nr:ADP-heptose--LPS heptosyltransferase RfaF [Allomuricauda hymeniacidonis]